MNFDNPGLLVLHGEVFSLISQDSDNSDLFSYLHFSLMFLGETSSKIPVNIAFEILV